MRIVLDTNALLISIPKNSKYRIIFDYFLAHKFTLVLSTEILMEYAEIIELKSNSIVSSNIVEMLTIARNVYKQDIFFKWQLIDTDKDDNKFVDCAVAGSADYIVTNDKHFSILKTIEFPPMSVITIDEFVEILKEK